MRIVFISGLCVFCLVIASHAATSTINADHPYAYGANVGWINARGDVTNGVVIGEYTCSGFLFGANIGWISMGGGSPIDGIRYGNAAANDYGVNHDGSGGLSGFAYGANIGWIQFETNYGRPRVDLLTGNLSGYAYGANIGWISLSNAQAFVRTDTIQPGADTNGNGIPDDWERDRAGNLTTLTSSNDYDNDTVLDPDEYRADTDPMTLSDHLHVVDYDLQGRSTSTVAWASRPTRFYYIEKSDTLTNEATWVDSGLGLQSPDAGTISLRQFPDAGGPTRAYRVKAVRPLAP
ncbi:MAG: hypothetical protein V2A34_00745 [Lentisphaerota bacterium]